MKDTVTMIATEIKVLVFLVLQSWQDGKSELFPSPSLPQKSMSISKPLKSRYAQVDRYVNRNDRRTGLSLEDG